jgi:hypothetical protein
MVGVEVSSLTFRRMGRLGRWGSLLSTTGSAGVRVLFRRRNTLKTWSACYDAAVGKPCSRRFSPVSWAIPARGHDRATLQAEGVAPGSGGLSSAAEAFAITAKAISRISAGAKRCRVIHSRARSFARRGITALYGGADVAIKGFYLDEGTVSLRSGGACDTLQRGRLGR